jgi:hypothetical protein
MRSTFLSVAVASLGLCCTGDWSPPLAGTTASAASAVSAEAAVNAAVYMCPMDNDIRSHAPGSCPRCGMKLVTSIPDPVEYHLELAVNPAPKPQATAHLRFEVFDPWKDNPVTKFTVVHEKLFHAFIVSQDLQFFVHGHPEWRDGGFNYDVTFPRPGMYRVLGDFYPEASTPQLSTKTLFVAGPGEQAMPRLERDYSEKQAQNAGVAFETSPEQPIAGVPAGLRLTITPADGLEKYLGAWAHMLAVSDDLIDMMHTHPFIADGSAHMQFNVVFPRARPYRVWVQFQRGGVVNTVHFDVPVREQAQG